MLKVGLIFLAIVLLGANVGVFLLGRGDAKSVAPVQVSPTPAPMQANAQAQRAPVAADAVDAPVASEAKRASTSTAPSPLPAPTRPQAPLPSGLIVPVQGITPAQLDDTFSDARAQGRVHEAIDIMAPRGTPVLAAADGVVEKLFTSVPGGLTIYQFEPSGRYAYYYGHLDRYADGLREKQALRQGQVIGYVGSTGNADPSAPHLHFAIFELGPERQWWKGTAINPYPLLKPQ